MFQMARGCSRIRAKLGKKNDVPEWTRDANGHPHCEQVASFVARGYVLSAARCSTFLFLFTIHFAVVDASCSVFYAQMERRSTTPRVLFLPAFAFSC